MATAVHLRLDAHARLASDKQRPHALRAVGLVRREGHQVDFQCAQIHRDLARRLRGIDMKDDPARAADLADRGDILDHADFVVHEHHRDDDRVRAQRRTERVEVEEAVILDVEIRDLVALTLQFAHGVERGLVLRPDGDEMLALVLVEVGSALQRQVDRLRRAGRPYQFLRVAADERGDVPARLFDGRLGGPAERMRTRGRIAEFLGQVGDHLLRDTRVHRRGRRIIEIDRKLHGSGWQAFGIMRWR